MDQTLGSGWRFGWRAAQAGRTQGVAWGWPLLWLALILAGSGCRLTSPARHSPAHGMARIPGGRLERGDALGVGYTDERPRGNVEISAFWMDRTEVTWGLWEEVRSWATNHGYAFLGTYDGHPGRSPDHPVCEVSWFDAVAWCNARSERDGLGVVYYSDPGCTEVYRRALDKEAPGGVRWGAAGYRLPTEAEWEWAARGGLIGQNYPWPSPGTNFVQTIDGTRANYWQSGDLWDSEAECATAPVAALGTPNAFGLWDMAGNVSEWCWDLYLDRWYDDPASSLADTRGPSSGYGRVLRGGSWISSPKYCRVSARYMSAPDYPCHCYGLRCVRRPPR